MCHTRTEGLISNCRLHTATERKKMFSRLPMHCQWSYSPALGWPGEYARADVSATDALTGRARQVSALYSRRRCIGANAAYGGAWARLGHIRTTKLTREIFCQVAPLARSPTGKENTSLHARA